MSLRKRQQRIRLFFDSPIILSVGRQNDRPKSIKYEPVRVAGVPMRGDSKKCSIEKLCAKHERLGIEKRGIQLSWMELINENVCGRSKTNTIRPSIQIVVIIRKRGFSG